MVLKLRLISSMPNDESTCVFSSLPVFINSSRSGLMALTVLPKDFAACTSRGHLMSDEQPQPTDIALRQPQHSNIAWWEYQCE